MKSSLRLSTIGAMAFGVAMVAACSKQSTASPDDQLVECYGVAKTSSQPLFMTKGMCDKLPFTKQTPVTNADYVQCYGVAAAGKADCATKTNSCGGKGTVAKDPNSWVSLPLGVCNSLNGVIKS